MYRDPITLGIGALIFLILLIVVLRLLGVAF
jgi:hypothetical protein